MKKITFTMLLALFGLTAMAQRPSYLDNPNYGANETERTENATLYSAFSVSVKLKDYKQASKELWMLIDKAPKASANIYVRGVDIYRALYSQAENETLRKAYLDTIMMVFDNRIKYYGNHPKFGKSYILAQKSKTFSNYATEDDTERQFAYFEEAIKSVGETVPHLYTEIIQNYFNLITDSYLYDDITADEYIAKYEILSEILTKKTTCPNAAKININIENLFAQSGAASCENIERIFKPKYLEDPNNMDQMKKILSLFSRAKCDSPFQLELLEKYYAIDPQADIAIMLAGVYEEKKDFKKAQEFMKVAIRKETDPEKKLSFLLRASGQTLATESYLEALNYAKEAIRIDPKNALAYFFVANAIASGVATQCSDETRAFGYWLVYDSFAKALSLMDADDQSAQACKTAMEQSKANFPKKTDLFMLGLKADAQYDVNCGWVKGTTKVRGR